jgi:hypothetical protein
MPDSEKPLKVFSGIVSGLLVASALAFLCFSLGKPKEAEAVLEYSAPSGFNPMELTSELHKLRRDQGFLVEVAIRSKSASTSDPNLAQAAAKLGSRLSFDANWQEPEVFIRFTHPKATTALDVTNAAAAVAKERLEAQQQKLATDILVQEDVSEDHRKLLDLALHPKASEADDLKKAWSCGGVPLSPASCRADYERALRMLEELNAKPVFSIRSIRAAKLRSD